MHSPPRISCSVTIGLAEAIEDAGANPDQALEPRQNRKRGDDLAAVEYIQKADPEIDKKKIKQTVEATLNKL